MVHLKLTLDQHFQGYFCLINFQNGICYFKRTEYVAVIEELDVFQEEESQ